MNVLLLALLLCTFAGCSIRSDSQRSWSDRTVSWAQTPSADSPPASTNELVFTYRVEGRNAIFDSDKVSLVFPDLPAAQRKIFALKSGFINIQIAGEGNSELTVNHRRNFTVANLRSRYSNGTNHFNFCGREVMLVDSARQAITGGQVFDLTHQKIEVAISTSE